MIEFLLDVRNGFRSRLASGSALERIGLLAGAFLLGLLFFDLLFPPVDVGLTQGAATATLWGVAMHYVEKAGWFSLRFGPESQNAN